MFIDIAHLRSPFITAITRMAASYSVTVESRKCLLDHILQHPAHESLPTEAHDFAALVKYTGSALPKIAIPWRFAESISSLKGLEATLLNVLLARKYGIEPQEIEINTDHAQLFIMSFFLAEVNPDPTGPVKPTELRELNEMHKEHFPSWDLHHQVSSQYRKAVTNIYRTKDDRFYHLHASLNPDPSLKALGLPWDMPELTTIQSSWAPFTNRMAEKTAEEWDDILAEQFKQAGTICHSPEEYSATPQGQAQRNTGLYAIDHFLGGEPCWWPDSPQTGPGRPLAGLKIVDLTRIVAGPSISRTLAELGASVMRVTGPHIADFSGLHIDTNWGKWNCHLDLRQDSDRAKFEALVWEADVVVNGYRPFVLDKFGVGYEEIFKLGQKRGRGYIYVRENCFGWKGPWSHRAGWQPISDACSGVAYGFGRAMGNDEPVVPVLPNSDYCTGVSGACGVLQGLLSRAEKGGSYLVSTAINYYNSWLANRVGVYDEEVWQELWARNGKQVFRHYHSMGYTAPHYMKMFEKQGLLNLESFEVRESGAVGGLKIRCPKPVLKFPGGVVKPGYNVGTRGNGVDEPRWPEDLMTEVVR
jgi:crotonobetainyl-CoA:carnitine CoA-transferase CaiB-like acyl-CoA transferase